MGCSDDVNMGNTKPPTVLLLEDLLEHMDKLGFKKVGSNKYIRSSEDITGELVFNASADRKRVVV